MPVLSLSQVPDSQNNNYVAWETMFITHKPGNCFCCSALWESIQRPWKGIIYLGPEKKPRSPRAPSGYCTAESHGGVAGERLPLAVLNPCALGCLSTRHPSGRRPLGSRAIVSGLLSQMEEGLLELEEPGFAGTTQSQSDWLAARRLLRPFLALLPGSQLDLDPFEEDVGRTGPGMSWYEPCSVCPV